MSTLLKGGKAYIVVGGTGMGKSTLIKKAASIVHPDNLLIYDVNREYIQYYPKPFLKFDQFKSVVLNSKGKLIIFEEATIFFPNRGYDSDLVEALVGKRHTENVFILVFHSFRTIPQYLFNLINYIIVYKTTDPPSIIDRFQMPELTDAFNDIRSRPMLKGETKDYSPHRIVQIIP